MTEGLNTQRFVKRPVEISAVKFTGTLENHRYLHRFLEATSHQHFDDTGLRFDPKSGKAFADGQRPVLDKGGTIVIRTLEGDHTATVGDQIIEGVAGEFYPCKSEIFDQTYEYVRTVDDPGQPALPGL